MTITHHLHDHAKHSVDHRLYEWFLRVRRDVLALELRGTNPKEWDQLRERGGLDAKQDEDETLRVTEMLLKKLGYPSPDPGPPPIPPYD